MSTQTFLLPDLGEGLTEAEVVRWLVEEGDTVEVDQPVVEVETAKSLVEVPTPYAGRIATRHAAEGVTLEVGKPLLTVAALVPEAETYREEEQAGSGNVLIGYGTTGATVTSRRRRPRGRQAPAVLPHRVPLVVSPLVRRLAREAGLDLATVEATGPGGVIVRADVERALARPATAPAQPAAALATPAPANPVVPGERRVPLTAFRKAVSAALTRSRAEIPEATVWVDVDATKLWELRQSTPGPGLLAYIARFVVAGLRQYPMLNARVDTERQEIVEFDRINLGIAVQGERGLVVPAVVGAETMTTAQLDEEIRRVTASAREGRVTAQEAGTFTLNNYGSFRVDGSAAIINHPQVAILGFGRILDRPWVVDGELCVRKITQMSFVFDHRVCDGGTAAGFMRSVADAIEDPASAIARL
ncbi:dihydrolipoamide acetyltransferase family protein [Actinoplanes sp. CA-051413]|uniref:dihydrolipoamide acetyltransferase family protein n=1 Tax=Actinoplanes sp. CA-051413 TaxID=3239899 RepID=UPI003D991EA7